MSAATEPGSRPAPGHTDVPDGEKSGGNPLAKNAFVFGQRAAAYAEHRPDYPDAAVEWALAPVLDRRDPRVLDLAAGTGKLSQVLQRQPVNVIAVEPDAAMREELIRSVPGVAALAGSAERIPLPADRVDAVLVGQAFHWFEPELALAEIARVLRPGGVLAAFWNVDDDRVSWVSGFGELREDRTRFSVHSPEHIVPAHEAFGPRESAEFSHVQRRTAESMVETMSTHSWMLTKTPDELEQQRTRILAYLKSRPETSDGEFDLPIVTRAIRTRLLDQGQGHR